MKSEPVLIVDAFRLLLLEGMAGLALFDVFELSNDQQAWVFSFGSAIIMFMGWVATRQLVWSRTGDASHPATEEVWSARLVESDAIHQQEIDEWKVKVAEMFYPAGHPAESPDSEIDGIPDSGTDWGKVESESGAVEEETHPLN